MIPNLQVKDFKGFTGGKNTFTTLTETPLEACLVAKNVMLGADGVIRKRAGYTLVQQVLQGRIDRIFDFQRQSDGLHQLLVSGNGQLVAADPTGAAAPVTLSAVDKQAIFDYVATLRACYMSNGIQALRYVNSGGQNKLYNWGIQAPGAAPTVATGSGTLNLQYGRQYVYCDVSILTDASGAELLSIGAPSPISAHTGPLTNSIVTLGLTPSTDAQVTHQWIFATMDAPLNSTSSFFFAAQVTNGTTSWGDTLADAALDTTRQAPWNNYPAPAAKILVEYASRIAALGIAGKPDMVQLSGYEEIDLGEPAEAWPPDLFFSVPAGVRELTAGAGFANSLMLSTTDFWYQLLGYSATTFEKRDRVIRPGAAGPQLVCVTPTHMAWVSKDKKLWAWDAVNAPFELSLYQRSQLAGTLSMEDLSDATLGTAVLRYFSYGGKHYILLLANSPMAPNGPGFDWIMAWELDSQGAPLQQSEVAQAGRAAQADWFFTDVMSAAASVETSAGQWLYFGDLNGNLYRWPDGFTDNRQVFQSVYGTPWHHCGLQSAFFNQGPSALLKRMLWLDVTTDRQDAADTFQVQAVCGAGVDMTAKPVGLPVGPVPPAMGTASDPTMLRASHVAMPGATMARWVRWFFVLPADDKAASILQYSPSFVPVYQVAP